MRGGRVLGAALAAALAVGALAPAAACRKRPSREPARPAPPHVEPPPAPLPPPPPPPGQRELTEAMAALDNGDPGGAADKLRAALAAGAAGAQRSEAIFTLALLHARPDAPQRDVPKARAYLEQVIASRPAAAREIEASLILALLDAEEVHAAAAADLRSQLAAARTESDELRVALASREAELKKIKEILLEKTPGR